MQRRVHIFTKFKNKHPWKYKKIYFFQLIHLKKILIFHICVSSENAQCLKQPYDKKNGKLHSRRSIIQQYSILSIMN